MKTRNKVIATGMSVALTLTMMPVVALADEQSAHEAPAHEVSAADAAAAFETPAVEDVTFDWIPAEGYDKADFYSEAEDEVSLLDQDARAVGVSPRRVSPEMSHFALYEAGGNYAQTFGPGDDYHALGYYQFDHRHGLQNFLIACYRYDSKKYAMFEQFLDIPAKDFQAFDAIRQKNDEGVWYFTELGKALKEAWVAACRADGEGVKAKDSEFARLQDDWAYKNYYAPAERYLAARGIYIADRNDAVKSLCWGMTNLFGSGGWRKFVGGVTSGYHWDGKWRDSYNWPGAGLNNDMTDAEFVSVLCNYVADNVAIFYKAQPQYHRGWQNRYRGGDRDGIPNNEFDNELDDYISIIKRTGDTHDIIPGSWYVPYIDEAKRLGIVKGYPATGDFRPKKAVTRAEVAIMLCRAEKAETGARPTNQTPWVDVRNGEYYTEALNWAWKNRIFTGDDNAGAATVRPEATITREEMAKVIATYMQRFHGANIDASGLDWPNGTSNTHDIEKLSPWAVPYFKWLANEGVMGGIVNQDGSVSLDPQGPATRAMFCKVVVEAVNW